MLLIAALLLCYLFSFVGLLISFFSALFYAHFVAAKRRNYINNFNSALRTTIQINGQIQDTAVAFSKSGPLRTKCTGFARRLTAGEEPFSAAWLSRLPLEIETAMALSLPETAVQPEPKRVTARQTTNRQDNNLSVASQLFYLILVCFAVFAASIFFETFIAPVLDSLLEESAIQTRGATRDWAVHCMAFVALAIGFGSMCFYLVAILGFLPALLAPSWIPLLPVKAARKSAILAGVATSLEHNVPLDEFCTIGAKIHSGITRRQFKKALRAINSGYTDANVIYQAGWISAADKAWLEDAPSARQVEILRNISNQDIRHADANLNWVMAIGYPAAILCLASAAAPFATAFFTELTDLITQL